MGNKTSPHLMGKKFLTQLKEGTIFSTKGIPGLPKNMQDRIAIVTEVKRRGAGISSRREIQYRRVDKDDGSEYKTSIGLDSHGRAIRVETL